MLKLHSLANTELSEYCIKILEKNGITLIREFLQEHPETLMKLLNINVDQLKEIEMEFRRLYGPKLSDIVSQALLKGKVPKLKFYGSQIDALDIMLAPALLLKESSFWEICGPAATGKTQLALTLILNFVMAQEAAALYIDTKVDFSATRIKNMLEARKIEPELHAGIMSFIKVERVFSAEGVVEMLEELNKQLREGNHEFRSIKMIIIDSLPAVWFLLNEEDNSTGNWLLSRISQNINRLCHQHNMAVICINLSLLASTEKDSPYSHKGNDIFDYIDADANIDLEAPKPSSSVFFYRPALGQLWLSKPHLRLSVQMPDSEDEGFKNDSSLRIIKLIKCTWHETNLSCLVAIKPEGVI